MNYQIKKRFHLIKIGLLLLTALCANVYAGHDVITGGGNTMTSEESTPPHSYTVVFAIILHTIDMSSCYAWLRSMNKRSLHKMGSSFMAQLWKIVWLSMIGVFFDDKISFKYAFLSKFAIDILAHLVRNSKTISTMLSHWPIGLAVVHCFAFSKAKDTFWGNYYGIFVLFFGIYYVAQKCYTFLSKKIIGDQSQRSNVSYLFDIGLGLLCTFVPYILSKTFLGLGYLALPFVILLLEYYMV